MIIQEKMLASSRKNMLKNVFFLISMSFSQKTYFLTHSYIVNLLRRNYWVRMPLNALVQQCLSDYGTLQNSIFLYERLHIKGVTIVSAWYILITAYLQSLFLKILYFRCDCGNNIFHWYIKTIICEIIRKIWIKLIFFGFVLF